MSKRIIIIEDEPLIAFDIREAVVELDCIVAGMAYTVADALKLLEEIPCDGAILDANLGGEDVRQVVDRLRTANIPFLIVSGYTRDQLEFLDCSAPLLGKPFAFDRLTAAIREHLLDRKS